MTWAPLGPLRVPNQSEQRWNREWKITKWCSYFRWCHKALPLYALKVVSLVPYWRWFGYTFTHSLVVSLLSPSHPSMMGSPHGPQLTHLLSHILLGFSFLLLDYSHIMLGFFFCRANNSFVNPFSWSFCLQNGITN